MPSIPSPAILLLGFLLHVTAISGPRSVGNNEKYITVQTLDVTTVYQQSYAAAWNPLTHFLPFPERFQYSSNLQVFFTIFEFNFDFPSNRINFYGRTGSKNQTGVVFNVYSDMSQYIKRLVYRYLLISGEYASVQADNTNLIAF